MTGSPVSDTAAMISGMRPVLDDDLYHFCALPGRSDPAIAEALAIFREDEGLSLILSERAAQRLGLPREMPMRRITLTVMSALDGIGLTAAVAGVLAREGIPCNMVAAYHHDHVFVPAHLAGCALALLQDLAGSAQGGTWDDTGQRG
ncbi:MAG: hypothetical protein COW54_04740 [Rhodobacteraceae bacterium CG17_big_fil_post_rev_8_21_14_2_50_63_15]|nr:ACT domain-containing protein [Roseovarius sp.]PIV79274.1 MAG: hypothetical protein COW54_04740 [Rhodobacteraceae bacterium CG17_big_fil_post_rev_8_21_14_2_50_63_15]